MIAVIMAGGRSTRLGSRTEKALLRLGGSTLLERTVAVLTDSKCPDFLVATSTVTPKTTRFAIKRGFAILETPGADYHDDVYFLLDRVGSFISVNVDIPFITPKAINALVAKSRKGSISCVLPKEKVTFPVDNDSVGTGKDGKEYVWIGLNFVTPSKDSDLLVLDDERLAVNINTPFDLAFAVRMLKKERKASA